MTFENLSLLIPALREKFGNGENVMEAAANLLSENSNIPEVIDFAYDLQAGSYTKLALANPQTVLERAVLRESVVRKLVERIDKPHVLEAGSGESTTLVALANLLVDLNCQFKGFDTSFSRVKFGKEWCQSNLNQHISVDHVVADMGKIPLVDNAMDLVYTNSALEPNGGRESELISELVRVSRQWIVLFEPIYENSNSEMQAWMDRHKYVRNLVDTVSQFAAIREVGILEESHLIPNPRGFIVAEKVNQVSRGLSGPTEWVDPIFRQDLSAFSGGPVNKNVGLSYPVLEGTPILKKQYAIFSNAIT